MSSISTAERLKKFQDLKIQRRKVDDENRKELYLEHQRNRTNPQKLKNQAKKHSKEEEEKLKNSASGDLSSGQPLDEIERKKLWNYSVEDNEHWEEKKAEQQRNKQNAKYSDYNQLAEQTYLKRINELAKKKQNSFGGEGQSARNSVGKVLTTGDSYSQEYAFNHRPAKRDVDLLVKTTKDAETRKITKTNKTREKNAKGTSLYINRKNKDFNEKLGRHYDKYTKEIRENFEKGAN